MKVDDGRKGGFRKGNGSLKYKRAKRGSIALDGFCIILHDEWASGHGMHESLARSRILIGR